VRASGSDGGTGETVSNNSSVPKNPGGKGGPGGGDGGDPATNSGSGQGGEDGYNTKGTGAGAVGWVTTYLTYVIATTGGSGGGHRTAGQAGKQSSYTYYSRAKVGKPGGIDGNKYINPLTGGGGGAAGQLGVMNQNRTGAPSGGGAGGGVELRSANNIEILGGKILAEGGDGGKSGQTYYGGRGGAGAGGSILIRTLSDIIADGATISVEGGKAGTGGSTYYLGAAGDGGHGWVRLDDSDGKPSLSGSAIKPSTYTSGTFSASGAGAPSIGQTLWMNMGVYDPIFLSSEIKQVIPKAGQTISCQIQGAPEDVFDFGMPDVDHASAWIDIADLTTLNGYGHSFIRMRVTFTLAPTQELVDPLPYVDSIKIVYEF
jgi:hypothetical protein